MNDRYHFDLRPDNHWVLYLPGGKRLFGRGLPFNDCLCAQFIEGLEGGRITPVLEYMLSRYGVTGNSPMLWYDDGNGACFVKNKKAVEIKMISNLLQQLVDTYRIDN